MKLTLNGQEYDVDMAGFQQRTAMGMQAMIDDKGDKNPLLRGVIKSACTMAMNTLGIKKMDRNDDPIKLVMFHIADLIFAGIEKEGLVVTGKLIEPPKAPAIETPEPEPKHVPEPPREE